ncbi:hypothetical protein O6H91_Y561000 [Diphasiastrum complanatum]|nr:hypothetical protein O6H91_Y561000 [Diphasiastrum complanatum]
MIFAFAIWYCFLSLLVLFCFVRSGFENIYTYASIGAACCRGFCDGRSIDRSIDRERENERASERERERESFRMMNIISSPKLTLVLLKPSRSRLGTIRKNAYVVNQARGLARWLRFPPLKLGSMAMQNVSLSQ